MDRDTLVVRNELFLASATIAAHSNAQGGSFRQRDVRFLVELFSNWASLSPRDALVLQNTQLSRYLMALSKGGFARLSEPKGSPKYRLTRLGLIELLTRISNPSRIEKKEQVFFLLYFIKNYRERLLDLVKSEGPQYPISLRVELEALLDTTSIIKGAISRTEQELTLLDARIEAAEATSILVKKRSASGTSLGEIIYEIEEKYPYELNSEKPLNALISEIPPSQRRWELESGTLARANEIWKRFREILNEHLIQLRCLKI